MPRPPHANAIAPLAAALMAAVVCVELVAAPDVLAQHAPVPPAELARPAQEPTTDR